MSKHPSREGRGSLCPRSKSTTRRPGSRSILFQLRDHGITPKAGEAFVLWAVRHGIETDFTAHQIGDHGECSRSTISRAIPNMVSAGYVELLAAPVYAGFRKAENRRGLYRFTTKFYALVNKAPRRPAAKSRRSDCTSPLVFGSLVIEVPTQVQHQHSVAPDDAHASLRASEGETEEAPQEVVQVLVSQAKLDEQGAKTAARAIPGDLQGEILPYLIQAGQAVVEIRRSTGRIRKTPEALLHHLLTRPDKELITQAQRLCEASRARAAEATAAGTDKAWTQAPPDFKAMPGAQEALHALLMAQRTYREAKSNPFRQSAIEGFQREMEIHEKAVVALAATALKLTPPEKIVDRFVWARAVLAQVCPGD